MGTLFGVPTVLPDVCYHILGEIAAIKEGEAVTYIVAHNHLAAYRGGESIPRRTLKRLTAGHTWWIVLRHWLAVGESERIEALYTSKR